MADTPELADAFASTELIVDIDLVDQVERHLADLNVLWAPDVERSDQLGLARLHGLVDARGPVTDLDGLMVELRILLGGDATLPDRIGKNRFVDAIVGSSGSKPMSAGSKPMLGGEPTPAIAPTVSAEPGTGAGVRIRVIDVPLPETGPPPRLLSPKAGHSLFVTSLIRVLAPDADVQVRPVLDAVTGRATLWHTATTMVAVADEDVDVINMSLGCYTTDGKPPLLLQRATAYTTARALVVAAAGNHGDLPGWERGRTAHSSTYPAALPGVVAVGAADDTTPDGLASFSPDLPWVRCTAPGVGVVGAYLTGRVQLRSGPTDFTGGAEWSGTSFATATVTGSTGATMAEAGSASDAFTALLKGKAGVVRRFTASPGGDAAARARGWSPT